MVNSNKKKELPLLLLIFDGFGWDPSITDGNAVEVAKMPVLRSLLSEYPWTTLKASGQSVGLLPGSIGNSEVGHLTIGAGQILPSSLKRIDQLVHGPDFFETKSLKEFFLAAKAADRAVHFLGLVSDGGVHSHINHLIALLEMAAFYGLKKIWVHAFLDGRDVAPRSASVYLEQLEALFKRLGLGRIASVSGRLYAMDRDKNYNRTDALVEVVTGQKKEKSKAWTEGLEASYEAGIDDQYVAPFLSDENGIILPDDFLFFFNARPERMQQIVERLCTRHQGRSISFVAYWDQLPVWAPDPLFLPIKNQDGFLACMSTQLPKDRNKIITIAESEKQAHVGYYLHGNDHHLVAKEEQIIIPSDKFDSYAATPRMKSVEITDQILSFLDDPEVGLVVANFANADMVGHSGDFGATVLACESLDLALGRIVKKVMEKNGTLVLTADHGNAEQKIDPKTGGPSNAHTVSPVLFLMVNQSLEAASFVKSDAGLSSVAPTILEFLGYEKSEKMDDSLKIDGSL
jgi:2,3-bisphosphoglycerate-independent phosphoglycerate mutase